MELECEGNCGQFIFDKFLKFEKLEQNNKVEIQKKILAGLSDQISKWDLAAFKWVNFGGNSGTVIKIKIFNAKHYYYYK